MSNLIEYSDDDFAVVKEKDYGDPVGRYRMIRYDTGYYALQRCILIDLNDDTDEVDFRWDTVCIAPQHDDPLTQGRIWNLCEGKLTIESILIALEDSSKLHNNELMELHLNINPNMDEEVSEKIVKLIKTSDGDNIYDNIIESIHLQDEYIQDYYSKQSDCNNLRLLVGLLLIITIGFLIMMVMSYGVV